MLVSLSQEKKLVELKEKSKIKENILDDEKYKYLFSVEAVNELVNKGVSFREAYKQVGNLIEKGEFKFDHKKKIKYPSKIPYSINLIRGAVLDNSDTLYVMINSNTF